MNTLAAAGLASAQQQGSTFPPVSQAPDATRGNHSQVDDPSSGPMMERMHEAAERAHNEDRRKRMLSDTEKLLALSTELKAEIEKSSKDELSMQVVRKAAEIEKLAHDVQQRMKG